MNYIERNRGFITCSKLKLFIKSKEAYKKVYVDEVDTSIIKQSPALEKGTLVDKYILSPAEFEQEYAILDGTLKADLVRQCADAGIPVDAKDKVEDLKAKLVGNKKVLTNGEIEMVQGIERELKRQPLYDWNGGYETQVELVAEYKGLKLKGTLDRLSVEKGLIRDLKTSSDIEYSPYNDITKFHNGLITYDEYQYGLQLARYRLLCKINYNKDFDCMIDAVKTTGNYASEFFIYDKGVLTSIANGILFPALNDLLECTKKNDFSEEDINRAKLINERYYPLLDSTIQKEPNFIQPNFIP